MGDVPVYSLQILYLRISDSSRANHNGVMALWCKRAIEKVMRFGKPEFVAFPG
ncbi:hypothetical protein PT300_01420 [Enterobacteriaceae bacterium ESL0689]|nr:hypothetical protein [Enterobacteriaceae bacterium ESL0689]